VDIFQNIVAILLNFVRYRGRFVFPRLLHFRITARR